MQKVKTQRKVRSFRHRIRMMVRRLPAPRNWPTAAYIIASIMIFLAGVVTGLLWQASPWYVALEVVCISAVFFALR